MTAEEEDRMHQMVSEEEVERMHVGVENVLKHIANLDKIGADMVKKAQEHTKDKFDIK